VPSRRSLARANTYASPRCVSAALVLSDPSFAVLASLPPSHPPPRMLLGVTNVFFVKALPAWPHVLSVGYKPPSKPPPQSGGGGLRAWGRGAIQVQEVNNTHLPTWVRVRVRVRVCTHLQTSNKRKVRKAAHQGRGAFRSKME
jgi:hypothetical protein